MSEHRLKYSAKPHSRVSPQRGIRVEEVCIYHIAEIYLYEYYKRPEEYRIAPKERIDALMEKAAQQEKTGGIIGAQQNYEKALQLNPVSTEIYWKLIDIDFRLNKLEDLHARTEEVYPYLCTRAEMAHYYRWLGYYYLETYKPELSEALYRYSTLFSKNEQAEHEITYLEAALGKKCRHIRRRSCRISSRRQRFRSDPAASRWHCSSRQAKKHSRKAAPQRTRQRQ